MPRRANKQKLFNSQVGGAGVLVGRRSIAEAFGVSISTVDRWQKHSGLKAYLTKLPGGEVVTTIFQIDRWVSDRGRMPMARARVALEALTVRERAELLLEMTEPSPASETTKKRSADQFREGGAER